MQVALGRVVEAINAINECMPTSSGVQDATSGLINACTDFNTAVSVMALQLEAAMCWLGTGGSGENCSWPSACDTFTVATPATFGNLRLYAANARGFLVPDLVHAAGDIYFQPGDADENYSMSFLEDIDMPLLETALGPVHCVAQKALTRFNAPLLTSVTTDLELVANSSLTEVNFPLLATVGNDFEFDGNATTSFDHPNLISVGRELRVSSDTITSINLDGLTTVGGDFRVECLNLTTMRLPSFTTWGGAQWSLLNSAFDEDTINYILELLDGLGVLAKFADLSGGTNAAPSGSGITALNNLLGKGWTVDTN